MSLNRVAQILGHESVDTTRIYTILSVQDLQREVEKVAPGLMLTRSEGFSKSVRIIIS